MSGYQSLGCRIKCLCSHWNSWFYPFKNRHAPCNSYPAIECTHQQRACVFFTFNHSIYGHIPFRRPFHYHHTWWTTKRRYNFFFDNVEKPKTTNKIDLDSWHVDYDLLAIRRTSIHFLILSEQKNNISCHDGCVQKCLKRCFFGAFDEKDNLSTCDSWCNDLFLISSVVHDSLRIDIKTTFSVWKRVDCQHFRILYVYFRSTSHTSYSRLFHRRQT